MIESFNDDFAAARDSTNPPLRDSVAYSPNWVNLTYDYRTALAYARLIES
jgi:hypothetical protein